MKIGCVGLGNIGRHLAANLIAAGFEVVVHDLNSEAGVPLVAAGATWCDSPADVAAVSDAVITCLPSVKAITAVVAGERGLADGFRPGGTWIEIGRAHV